MDISTKAILLTIFVVAFTAVAALVDWRTHKLPNWLTVSCFACALLFHFVAGFFGEAGGLLNAVVQVGWALLGFATGFSILFVLWLIGGGGGGDAKLMGALGAWLMPRTTLYVFVVSYVFVLILMLGIVVWAMATGRAGQLKKAARDAKKAPSKKSKGAQDSPWKRALPYGVSVAFATWAVLAYLIVQHIFIKQTAFPFLS